MSNRYKEHFIEGESDCTVVSDMKNALSIARTQLIEDRKFLKKFALQNPKWIASYDPIVSGNSHPLIEAMEYAAKLTYVGPMAAVAGVLADRMVDAMKSIDSKVSVVENGGEIMIESTESVVIGLYVLTTVLKSQLGFEYQPSASSLGLGTSSGQFGHASSLGDADTATIFAQNAGLGDAAATYVCNAVKGSTPEDALQNGLIALDRLLESGVVFGGFLTRGDLVAQKGKVPPLIKITT